MRFDLWKSYLFFVEGKKKDLVKKNQIYFVKGKKKDFVKKNQIYFEKLKKKKKLVCKISDLFWKY